MAGGGAVLGSLASGGGGLAEYCRGLKLFCAPPRWSNPFKLLIMLPSMRQTFSSRFVVSYSQAELSRSGSGPWPVSSAARIKNSPTGLYGAGTTLPIFRIAVLKARERGEILRES